MNNGILKRINLSRDAARKIILTALFVVAITLIIALAITKISNRSNATYTYTPSASEHPAEVSKETQLAATAPKETEAPVAEAPAWAPDPAEVEALAKTLYGECRGVKSQMEQAAVAWVVLNRVDSRYYPNTVLEVITQPRQFHGYDEDYPVLPTLKAIAEDVLTKWHMEKTGEEDCGRVLPATYIYFVGDGTHNYFTEEFLGKDYWDFSLPNPYEN